MRSSTVNHQTHKVECTETCGTVRWAKGFVCGLICAVLLVAGSGKAHRLSGQPHTIDGKLKLAKGQVAHDRRSLQAVSSHHWTLLSPLPVMAVVHRAWLARDRAYVKQLERAVVPSWLWNAFLCIHRGEGAWTSNTGNGYYGGLQMDYGFMSTYGGRLLAAKGTADRWTPAEQIAVAIRAYSSGRGFYPWPTTARNCGLI